MTKSTQAPAERLTERMPIVVSRSFLAKLDQWRAKQPGVPNRSEAMRTAFEIACRASEAERQR
jgi:hypothetical protein